MNDIILITLWAGLPALSSLVGYYSGRASAFRAVAQMIEGEAGDRALSRALEQIARLREALGAVCGIETCGCGDEEGVCEDCTGRYLIGHAALRSAATWVLHVISGVGKAGGPPESGEYESACAALAAALEEQS